MMKRLLATLVMLLLATTAVVAQDDMMDDDTMTYCGDLSEADCDLFNSAQGNLPDSTAFDAQFNIMLDAGEADSVDFAIDATGGYVLSPGDLQDALDAAADVTLLDANMGNLLDIVDGAINSFDGELLITITPPAGEVPPMFETVPVNLWLVDGVGYIDLSPAAMFDPGLEGVFGMDLADTARYGLQNVTIGDLLDGAEAAGEGLKEGFGDGFGQDGEAFDAFQDQFETQMEVQMAPEEAVAFMEEVATIERTEDSEINGNPVAVFELTLDLAALFQSEPFMQGFAASAPEEMPFTAEEFSEALVDSLGDDTAMTMQYFIGLEDNIGYGFELDLAMSFDPNALAALEGEEMPDTEMESVESINMTYNIRFTRSEVNTFEAIAVPENAVIVTIEELVERFSPDPSSEA